MSARLRAPWLDRELAAGAPTWRSPVHAARALQLTSDRNRRREERSLERLVELAEEPAWRTRGAAILPCREQVRAARPLIFEISSRLRRAEPVDARGVASLRELLSDGAGPCYARSRPAALTDALQAVSGWLEIAG